MSKHLKLSNNTILRWSASGAEMGPHNVTVIVCPGGDVSIYEEGEYTENEPDEFPTELISDILDEWFNMVYMEGKTDLFLYLDDKDGIQKYMNVEEKQK